MRYDQPPQELATAISKAASRNGVPYAVMVGIWRFESGSTFPNPAVNSSGYGGLFGTTNWNASTQAQADEAASILAAGLKQSGGDIAGALSYYNTGNVNSTAGHDYASKVLTASGAVSNVATPATRSSTGQTARPRPGGGGDPLGAIWGDVSGAAGAVGSTAEAAADSAWKAAVSAITGPWEVLKLFVFLSRPLTWLRVFEALLGAAIMGLSLALLARVLLAREAALAIPGLGRLVAAAPRAGVISRGSGRTSRSSSSSSSPTRRSSSRPPDELAAARARTERERAGEVRARRRRSLEEARDRRREREARERRAYFRGAADAGR